MIKIKLIGVQTAMRFSRCDDFRIYYLKCLQKGKIINLIVSKYHIFVRHMIRILYFDNDNS